MTKHLDSANIPTFQRELNQLAFNARVLAQAKDPTIPLLERLNYLFITSDNLDEFFEVKVANLKHELHEQRVESSSPDSSNIDEILSDISLRAHDLVDELFRIYNQEIYPALVKEKICFLKQHDWTKSQRLWIANYFEQEILPVISPIALDLAHPFPKLVNKNLNFIVSLAGLDAFGRDSGLAIVHAPRSIPRLIPVPKKLQKNGNDSFFLLTSMIKAYVSNLFPGMTVKGCYQFRIIRNSDLLLDEHEIDDLPMAVKTSLIEQRFGVAVRLDVESDCPQELIDYLLQHHQLEERDLYKIDGQVNFGRLSAIFPLLQRSDLMFPSFTPSIPEELSHHGNLFHVLKQRDIILYHPYQSFEPVINLVRQATQDSNVVAIKQTLYRTNADSAIVNALVEAARAGIEVTAVVELRARADEAQNISLATRLQAAGAMVVYGVVGYKTHAKMLLIVRREQNELYRYVHLGTGNYHARTAREYTDLSLFTADIDIGHDVQLIFQELTGMGRAINTSKLWHAPFTLYQNLEKSILKEINHAKHKKKAHIIFKINALTDPEIVTLLYQASIAGVKVELIVRSMCILKPNLPGWSDKITVRSIVGRFLEHARVFYFYDDGNEKLYCSSADLMERNLYHRLEVCFPILDPKLRLRIKEECLDLALKDNCQSWELLSDGSYKHHQPEGKTRFSVQEYLLEHYECYKK